MSNVLVQHQQASGVMRASLERWKTVLPIYETFENEWCSTVSEANLTNSQWEKHPGILATQSRHSRPTTTTTTTNQDLESYRWLVTNCKYSFPAWSRHANLADRCQMRSVSSTVCQSPCKSTCFCWITMTTLLWIWFRTVLQWYELHWEWTNDNKRIKGTHPLTPPCGMLTDGWSWNCACFDWQQLSWRTHKPPY